MRSLTEHRVVHLPVANFKRCFAFGRHDAVEIVIPAGAMRILISSENYGLSIANFVLDHALGLAQRREPGDESARSARHPVGGSVAALDQFIAASVQLLTPGGY